MRELLGRNWVSFTVIWLAFEIFWLHSVALRVHEACYAGKRFLNLLVGIQNSSRRMYFGQNRKYQQLSICLTC